MKNLTGSLQGRLLLSHLGVVILGVAVLLVAGRRLGSVFVGDHLRSMGGMMGGLGQRTRRTGSSMAGHVAENALTNGHTASSAEDERSDRTP